MAIRKIIKIDEERCDGCGLCVPNCAEGAIQIIDGKAKLVKDSYCDGLGACLGHCPQDALHIIEREADDFNEEEAMEFVKKTRGEAPKHNHAPAHQPVHHHHHHGGGGCPGSRMMMLNNDKADTSKAKAVSSDDIEVKIKPQLRQWPVQLSLVPVNAPYFNNADLLVTADCVPFAYPNYHLDLLKGKAVVIGCPKLDDLEFYIEKLTDIIESNNLKSITVAHMEVPCCSGIVRAVDVALQRSGKDVPVTKVRIGINGEATQR
ncbi:MAG: 4Fe-4S binding protein [Clostridia bacterium]|nr:4Fe-4S binding protein [Clostridia bacterium]